MSQPVDWTVILLLLVLIFIWWQGRDERRRKAKQEWRRTVIETRNRKRRKKGVKGRHSEYPYPFGAALYGSGGQYSTAASHEGSAASPGDASDCSSGLNTTCNTD